MTAEHPADDDEAAPAGRRGYHHGNLRQALVDATLDLIAERGPQGFTLAEAAKRAGVSAAAPYRHFAGRDELIAEVDWGRLDILLVDMPPGTGDAQLAIAQGTPLAGAVIVSTPQDLALIDARRGIAMFRKVDVPILGLIENMAHFLCPDCGSRHDIFGAGGAEAEARRLGVPYLGAVPLTIDLRAASDAGRPILARDPDGPLGQIYGRMAAQLCQTLAAARRAAAG